MKKLKKLSLKFLLPLAVLLYPGCKKEKSVNKEDFPKIKASHCVQSVIGNKKPSEETISSLSEGTVSYAGSSVQGATLSKGTALHVGSSVQGATLSKGTALHAGSSVQGATLSKGTALHVGSSVQGATLSQTNVLSEKTPYEVRCDHLCQQLLPVIQEFECINKKPVEHPYLDSSGLIHIGYGSNIENWDRFKEIDFINNTNKTLLLTSKEKKAYYEEIKNIRKEQKSFNYLARYYKKKFVYQATQSSMEKICQKDIKNCFKGLEKALSSQKIALKDMPNEAILPLLDIYYNTGNLNPKKWPKLYQALKKKDYTAAAGCIHRRSISEERNTWTKNKMLQAAEIQKNYMIAFAHQNKTLTP